MPQVKLLKQVNEWPADAEVEVTDNHAEALLAIGAARLMPQTAGMPPLLPPPADPDAVPNKSMRPADVRRKSR